MYIHTLTLRVTRYALRVTRYALRVTRYALRARTRTRTRYACVVQHALAEKRPTFGITNNRLFLSLFLSLSIYIYIYI